MARSNGNDAVAENGDCLSLRVSGIDGPDPRVLDDEVSGWFRLRADTQRANQNDGELQETLHHFSSRGKPRLYA
jgi:hypothetical protein